MATFNNPQETDDQRLLKAVAYITIVDDYCKQIVRESNTIRYLGYDINNNDHTDNTLTDIIKKSFYSAYIPDKNDLLKNPLLKSLFLKLGHSQGSGEPYYVQKLLHNVGQGFAGYVRDCRLERCRADLADRCLGSLSITEICFRWGFNDAAHFSRSFRARYGLAPKDFRKASGVRWDEAWARMNCAERAAALAH